ncbi:MAG: lipase family protein [Proteobacteria bacterium]|nr:lipase family protein [Pseudomonadota bacterium]
MPEYFEHSHLLTPPTRRAAYSDRTAWIMATLSALAYERFEDSEAITESLKDSLQLGKFDLVATFVTTTEGTVKAAASKAGNDAGVYKGPRTDTQAILVKSDAMAVLAFRGSEPNIVDWLFSDADAVFVKLPEGEGKIHRGFYESFLSVREKIEKVITDESKLPGTLPLYVTGHSLGAALASVGGMELEKVRSLAAIYTFGSPRVGDDVWANRMKVPVYRIVNGRDLVPMLPFSSLIGNFLRRLGFGFVVRMVRKVIKGYIGYCHVGDFRHLTQDGRLVTGSAATFSRLGDIFVDGTGAIFRRSVKIFGIALKFGTDHLMPGYIAKLAKVAVERNPPTTDA